MSSETVVQSAPTACIAVTFEGSPEIAVRVAGQSPLVLANFGATPASALVVSVNGKSGVVVLSASDVGADESGAADAAVTAHVAATDPHGDRAYADAQIAAVGVYFGEVISNINDSISTEINDRVDGDAATLASAEAFSSDPENITQDSAHRFVADAEKSTWNGKQDPLGFTPENSANKAVANGYAGLDSSGKVPTGQLPDAVLGALKFKGSWNATTGIITSSDPALNGLPVPAASSANNGYYFITAVAGSTSEGGITDWNVGDWLVSDGAAWIKVDNTDAVSMVNGHTGVVVLNTDDIAESGSPTNKWFTSARALAVTLLGLSTSDSTDITASDSILVAFGKAAARFAAIATSLAGKVAANTAISGATKTKITYDSKGLVTSGADATTADIADSSDKRYITDAQRTVIGNTSGTNTGDETGARIAVINHAAAAKSALVDADEVTGQDSASSYSLIRTTWTQVWTYIKSKADAVYVPYAGASAGLNLGSNNVTANNTFNGATLTATSGQTITMTSASARTQIPTGSSAITYKLPDATTLTVGAAYKFNNNSSGSASIQDAGGNAIVTVTAGSCCEIICTSNGSANGTWDKHWLMPSSGRTIDGITFDSTANISHIAPATHAASSTNYVSGIEIPVNIQLSGTPTLYRFPIASLYSGFATLLTTLTNKTITGLLLTAGTSALSPLKFAAGTLNAIANILGGEMEWDGQALNFSHSSTNRAVVKTTQFQVLTADATGGTATATNQQIFNSTTNGAFNIEANRSYKVKALIHATCDSTSANKSFGFLLGGGATCAFGYMMKGSSGASDTALAAANSRWMSATGTTQLFTSNTGASISVEIEGIITCTVAGTITPVFSQGTNVNFIFKKYSFCEFEQIGLDTANWKGNWT